MPTDPDDAATQEARLLCARACGSCDLGVEIDERDANGTWWHKDGDACGAGPYREQAARIAALEAETATLREQLAEAAREIACAGPVAHRIRVLKQEHAAQLATAEARGMAYRAALEACPQVAYDEVMQFWGSLPNENDRCAHANDVRIGVDEHVKAALSVNPAPLLAAVRDLIQELTAMHDAYHADMEQTCEDTVGVCGPAAALRADVLRGLVGPTP